MKRSPTWTPREKQFLAAQWGKRPAVKIAVALQRSLHACRVKANRLGLRSERYRRAMASPGQYKGAAFYNGILAEFATHTTGEMALRRGVSVDCIRTWVKRAKWYRDEGRLR